MKKTTFILLILLSAMTSTVKAQDTIAFVSGELKIMKIVQVKSEEIICKDTANLAGPDYIYNLKKISEIHYKNGKIEVYSKPDEDIEYINDVPVKSKEYTLKESKASFSPLPSNLANSYNARREYYKGTQYISEYGDPYNPWVAGFASYFLPGLGQIVCGETGRGLAFLGGVTGAYVLTFAGIAGLSSYNYDGGYYNGGNSTATMIVIGGAIATAGIYIWNIFDAVQVAKVNNLYRRDLEKHAQLNIQIAPYIDMNKQLVSLGEKQPTVGLSLHVNF